MVVRSTTLPGLVVPALALVLTGCGGTSSGAASAPSPGATSTVPGIITPSSAAAIVPPAFRDKAQGIISDTRVTRCDDTPGMVKAEGTVTNSAAGPRDIVITISWATMTTSDVVARGIVVLHQVPQGVTRDWTITGTPLATTEPVACVPTAERGQLAAG